MYERSITEISRKHLEKVIQSIDEPIVVLGGWAVFFLVNERYRELTGRDYIGSMDIDLGFRLESGDINQTTFARVLKTLVEDLGFQPQSFRLYKQMRLDTGEPLTEKEAGKLQSYEIFQMFVDLVVDEIPSGFKENFGFTPIDEPLLKPVFAGKENRTEVSEFGRAVWLPTPRLLLAMKIKSLPDRQKDYKKLKDVADAAALILFCNARRKDIIGAGLVTGKDLKRFDAAIQPEDIGETARILGMEPETIGNALRLR